MSNHLPRLITQILIVYILCSHVVRCLSNQNELIIIKFDPVYVCSSVIFSCKYILVVDVVVVHVSDVHMTPSMVH